MKTLIATLAMMTGISGFSNSVNVNPDPKTVKPVSKSIVYLWKVKSSKGEFTGTSRTVKGSNREIEKLTKGSKIYSRKITPVNVNPNNTDKVYVWEVKTERGYARGVSESQAQAQKSVKLMNQGEVLNSKIVESFTIADK